MVKPIAPINAKDERDRAVGPVDFSDSELDEEPLPGEPQITENEDGSADVNFGEEEDSAVSEEFLVNLATTLPSDALSTLSTRMLEAFDRDKESRKKRDEQYADGIRRTGLGNDAPGGAEFTGASRAVHPILIEGCIEFAARSMKELFPPTGPVKTHIIGEQTEAKLSRAERKKTYMNWQLTKQIKEYRSELEQTLTQVPLGGSQYLKIWHSDRVERPRAEFIPVDEMLLPFAAGDFYCSERKTHVQRVTKDEFEGRVASGLYRDVAVGEAAGVPESTAAAKASDRVEGKEDPSYDADGLRTIFESYCELSLEDDPESKGAQRGYILTIDESSRHVLALYRNWDEADTKKCPETLEWIVEFGFIPWRGAYKIGLSHIIGGLSGALTGSLRALLDSAHLQNTAGGVMLKGSRTPGQTIETKPTEFTALEGPPNCDDIRKLAAPYPFNGPSEVLFSLMQWLTTQAKGVVSTASEAIKDAGSDMPVGTALALIEQGSITFSAVHARLHASQQRVLNILHRINGQYLDDEVTVEELGSLVVGRKDFQGAMDIIPVSDPNIFSDAQRYAQNQAAMAMAEKFPGAFKLPKLIGRAMQLMNYPAWEEVVNFPAEAKRLGALDENVLASKPEEQLKVYSDQDDLEHLQMHIHFMASPIFCANPMMAMPALPVLLAHCKEHLLALYKKHVAAASAVTKHMLPGKKAMVQGAAFADQELAKEMQELMPLLEQAQALAQKLAPKPPADPRTAVEREKLGYLAQKDAADRAQQDKESAAGTRKELLEQQAESARSTQEMQVAARNADLASNAERMAQFVDLLKAHMQQDAEDARAAQANALQLMMAELKAGREDDRTAMQNDFAQLQGSTQQQFDLIQTLLTQKNASASQAAEHQIQFAQQTEQQAHEAEQQAAQQEHEKTLVKMQPKPAPGGKGE